MKVVERERKLGEKGERKLREKGERKQKGVVENNILFLILYIYIMGIFEQFRNFVGGRTKKRRTKRRGKSRKKTRGKTRKKTRRKRRKRQKGGS